jgi:hypothetical protein
MIEDKGVILISFGLEAEQGLDTDCRISSNAEPALYV